MLLQDCIVIRGIRQDKANQFKGDCMCSSIRDCIVTCVVAIPDLYFTVYHFSFVPAVLVQRTKSLKHALLSEHSSDISASGSLGYG